MPSERTTDLLVTLIADDDIASANCIECGVRILGTVTDPVAGDEDGYLSAERWLLHDWEYLIPRRPVTQIEDVVNEIVTQLGLASQPKMCGPM